MKSVSSGYIQRIFEEIYIHTAKQTIFSEDLQSTGYNTKKSPD